MRRLVVFFALCLFLGWALAACRQGASGPKLEYQSDPTTLVIGTDSRTDPVGPMPGEMCNYIPDLRVWGDGRVVYSHFQDGTRVVQAGSLDAVQIRSLLQTLAEAGFFQKSISENNPAGTYFSLVVNLKSGRFSSTWSFPTDIYSALSDRVARMDIPDYTPDRALLISTPCSSSYCPRVDALPEWPDRFGFSLTDAEHGGWISGEALSFVWQAVNTTLPAPGFHEGNKDYGVVLEIPGVSWSDPPYDCWGSKKSIVH